MPQTAWDAQGQQTQALLAQALLAQALLAQALVAQAPVAQAQAPALGELIEMQFNVHTGPRVMTVMEGTEVQLTDF
jgi:hypothetical protein